MSGFLLDTCVLSEFRKPAPDRGLVAWLEAIDETTTYISSLTVGELRFGIARSPAGRKRNELERWLSSEVVPTFAGRILQIGHDVADRWGRIRADADARGKSLSPLDALIAATAMHYNLGLVTRNEKHFPAGTGIVNPWSGLA